MKDRELEVLLSALGEERFSPPDHLLASTKRKIIGGKLFNVTFFLCLLLNALVTIFFMIVMIQPQLKWLYKISLYFGITIFSNAIAVIALLYKAKISAFWQEVAAAINQNYLQLGGNNGKKI